MSFLSNVVRFHELALALPIIIFIYKVDIVRKCKNYHQSMSNVTVGHFQSNLLFCDGVNISIGIKRHMKF